MKRALISLSTAILISSSALANDLPAAPPEKVGLSAVGLGRVTAHLKSEVEKGRIPGAVVAVARRGHLAYFEAVGYQDAASKAPMPKDAIFALSSMTKPMVSVALMMLHDEGKLQLSDAVGRYLPQLAKMQVGVVKIDTDGKETVEMVPAARQPTIQDLLRHTSGIGQSTSGATAVHKMWPGSSLSVAATLTGSELIDALSKVPLLHQPGTIWDYGLSTEVLGIIMEKIAGTTLSGLLEERLWKPLGMADTGFSIPAAKKSRHAQAFPDDPVTKKPQSLLHADRPVKFECGGACAVGTVMDYLRFAQFMLNGGTLDGRRLISRKTVELMTADHLTADVRARTTNPNLQPGYGFGLGYTVRGQTGIATTLGSPGEYGWGGFYGTYFIVDPKEELVMVYMTAAPGAAYLQNRLLVKNLVAQSIID